MEIRNLGVGIRDPMCISFIGEKVVKGGVRFAILLADRSPTVGIIADFTSVMQFSSSLIQFLYFPIIAF